MDAHDNTQRLRCLLLPEIFNNICTQFDENPARGGRDRRRPLNALARTCRALQDIALDHLWFSLPNLVLLIKCMPPDLWRVDRQYRTLRLNRTTVDSDWPRFLEYSRRVQIMGRDKTNVGLHSLIIMQRDYEKLVLPPHTLFPNLRTVRWDQVVHKEILYIPWHVGPNVESLSIISPFTWDDSEYQSMITAMTALRSSSPLVRRVRFEAPHGRATNLVSMLLNEWTLVELLEVRDISSETFSSIATLPNLHTLTLYDQPFAVLPATSGPVFPALQVLNITTTSLPFCTNLVQCFQGAALKSIFVSLAEPGTPSAWKAFFTAVAAHCKTATLTSLSIIEQPSSLKDDGPAPQLITIDTLSPLLALPYLETVGLSFHTPLHLKPPASTALARAWPELTTLNMCPVAQGRTRPPPPRLALDVFAPFVAHCPRLRHLDIYIDASRPPAPSAGSQRAGGRTGVFPYLGVGPSVMGDPERAVEELWRVFPGGIGRLEADYEWENPVWPGVAERVRPRAGEGDGACAGVKGLVGEGLTKA